jgi:hypothetical protein
MRAEVFGGTDALPLRSGLRRLPAEIADGWGGEGDALEGADLITVGESAFDYALVGFDLDLVGGMGGAGRRRGEKREC